MKNHIYAFGSVCRGEVTLGSDVDLLACIEEGDDRFSNELYSIYTYDRIIQLWEQGNPFAWHLALESRLIFSFDGIDYIKEIGMPKSYNLGKQDCEKFYALFRESYDALINDSNSKVFNLSSIFLSIRNAATCYSLSIGDPVFSRQSALMIDTPAPLSSATYDLLEKSRILATRGIGNKVSQSELDHIIIELATVFNWMEKIIGKVK